MDKMQYLDHCKKIVELVEGMNYSQWCKIRKLIEDEYQKEQAKVSLSFPEHLDLLMKQNLIK